MALDEDGCSDGEMGESGMSGRRNRTIALRLVSYVLAVFCALACAAMPAYASTSSEMSDDGQDYGWLFRRGDVLYPIEEPTTPLIYFDGGEWYGEPGEHSFPIPHNFYSVREQFYKNGALSIQVGLQLCMPAVLRMSGRSEFNEGQPVGPIRHVISTLGGAIGSPNKYPRLLTIGSGTGVHATDIKYVFIDDDLPIAVGQDSDSSMMFKCLDRWFEGCENLLEIEGLQNVATSQVSTMARMFYGCAQLEAVDISGFDTRSCNDFGQMFEGCDSLATLTTGEGWTQAAAKGDTTSDESAGHLATFPVAMACERDGETVRYEAGDVIPDGAAIYTVADLVEIDSVAITLVGPDGSTWTKGESAEPLTCEYTGDSIEPDVLLVADGTALVEGENYTVSYRNNVEDGTAEMVLTGRRGCHGRTVISFNIIDTGAYAFLYEDGLLTLNASHHYPNATSRLATKPLDASWRWFDAASEEPGTSVPWKSVAGKVRRVVVDPSFASVSPVTMAGWFAGCAALTKVEGLANVDASRVSSMAGLFRNCAKLGELDLSGLGTSGVADFSGLVAGCSSLERLALGNLDLTNAKTAVGFFEGCGGLNGLSTGTGFANAELASARLALPEAAYRTEPGYARMDAGAPVPDGAGTYRLRNLALQLCTVEMDKDTYTCTGKPIKPRMTVRLGKVTLREGADYAVAYEDNVYPGNVTPKATITGRGVFSGGLVVPFRIVSRVTQVGDRLVIRNKTGTFVVRVTKVSKNGKAAEVAVVSVEAAPGIKSMSLPSECTVGNVKVSVTTVSSKLTGRFRNVTSVVIGAKVTTIGAKAFSRATKVRTLVVKSARLKTVKNCLSGSRVTKVRTKVSLSSTKRRTYKRWFTSRSTVGKSVTYSYG